jgi:hypothetical protein
MILIVLHLLVVQTLDGREIVINPREIISLSEARDAEDPGKHYTDAVRCVIDTTDGKLITVAEECESIRLRMEEMLQ